MNILLIIYDNQSYSNYFPLGSAYIASALQQEDHNVTIYNQDVYHYSKEHLKWYLENNDFDIIGLGIIAGYYQYKKLIEISDVINNVNWKNKKPIYIIGGHGPSPEPSHFLQITKADYVVIGEGEITICELLASLDEPEIVPGIAYLNDNNELIKTDKRKEIKDVDSIPFPEYSLFPIDHYAMCRESGSRKIDRAIPMLSGRGCPYKCLDGNTIINTIEGDFKIKNLVGKKIKVLTRNKKTKELLYADAFNICKTQENVELVRVNFKDGNYIDCTPDHKFLTFKNSNQFCKNVREHETEAQNLKKGDSVRAIHNYKVNGYSKIMYGRKKEYFKHRLIMESMLDRKLNSKELIHHIDKNKDNNIYSNLKLVMSEEHTSLHSEIRERMIKHNPMKNKECRNKRKKEINHVVDNVIKLSEKKDVYCMEVPGYDWFFANDILVHNCAFCYRLMKGFRPRSSESIIEEIKFLKKQYNISYIIFADELLMSSVKRTTELCEAIIKNNLNIGWWCNGRLNFAKKDLLKLMKRAGCKFVNYGIEAIDDIVLRYMNKNLTVDKIIKGVENTAKVGIQMGLNVIWGNIGDNKKVLKKDVEFLKKYGDGEQLRTIRFCTMYPGTPLYYYCIEKGLLKGVEDFYENKHKNSDLLTINLTSHTDKECYDALRDANNELINDYYEKNKNECIKQCVDLYNNKNANFRGFRSI